MINNMRSRQAATFITLRWCCLSASVSGRKMDGWLNTSQSRLIHLRLFLMQVLQQLPPDCCVLGLSGGSNTAPRMGWIPAAGSENWFVTKNQTVQTVWIGHWRASASSSPAEVGLLVVHINLRTFFLFFLMGSFFYYLLQDTITFCIPARASGLLEDSSSQLFSQCFWRCGWRFFFFFFFFFFLLPPVNQLNGTLDLWNERHMFMWDVKSKSHWITLFIFPVFLRVATCR